MTVPVSVVIPYYNAQTYLSEALASVRAQSVPPEEIIIVDDGSEPSARDLLSNCGSDVRVITFPENRGPGAARNAGVEAATQPYVAFLDADDAWLTDKLEVQYEFMRSWPQLDVTHTDVVFYFKDGTELRRDTAPRELSLGHALSQHVMMTPSVMIKKSSFENIGGFDTRFRCTQDWEMQIRMVQAGFQIQFLPGHPTSSSSALVHRRVSRASTE